MKRLLILFCFILIAGCGLAQQPQSSGIPPYRILTTDSVYVTPAKLKKNKPVMIIYFQPDCSHCEHLMHDMKPQLSKIRNVQVVLITFVLQLDPIRKFQHSFGLDKYPNFTIGTEGYTYVVQRFYNVQTTPYIAIYDKNGKLFKTYDKVPKIADLMSSLKKV